MISRLCFALVWLLGLACVSAAPAVDARDTGISIGDIINALQLNLVKDINVTLTLDSLVTNKVNVTVDITNSLPIELTIDHITSSAGINGTEFAAFDHTFPKGLVLPPFKTVNSGLIQDVLLTQGALAALEIVPLGVLDLLNTDVNARAFTIFGKLGIPIPINGLKQKNVPTTYDIFIQS